MTLDFVIPQFNINGAGTPPIQFFRRGFILNGTGGSQPSWKDIILHGVTALTLVNAKEDSLNYLTLFGGTEQLAETYIDSVTLDGKCEQNGTPTPTVPVDIVCNNGVISYDSVNDTIIATGTTESVTDNVGNVATAQMLLSVGDYKDTQEVLTGAVTHNVGIKVLDGTETFTVSSSGAMIIPISDVAIGATNNPINTHFGLETSATSIGLGKQRFGSHVDKIYSTNYYMKPPTTMTTNDFKQYLTEQYNAGTPVIVVYPLAEPTTETVTGQILQKAPVTVTGSLTGLVANVVSSSHTTPTPTQPLPINTNNGVLTFGAGNTYNTADGQGTFVSPIQSLTTRIYKSFGQLKAGKYKVKITGDFEFIFQYKDTNDIAPTNYGNIGTWATEGEYEITDTSLYYGVAIRNGSGSGNIYPSNFNNIGSIGYSYLDVVPVGTTETIEITGKNLNGGGALDNKGYTSTGGTSTSTTFCGTLWKIKVKEGEKYTVSYGNFPDGISGVFVNTWKTDGTWNLRQAISISSAYTYTIPVGIGEVNFTLYKTGGITIASNSWLQVEKGDTATPYEPYYNGGSATAEMLLKVGDYQDVQSVLDGVVTRNVGVLVLDGVTTGKMFSSAWNATYKRCNLTIPDMLISVAATEDAICNLFPYSSSVNTSPTSLGFCTNNGYLLVSFIGMENITSANDANAWLAQQYNSGNPVIVLYPKSTATTETVTGQPLTIQAGTNVVEITQASIDGLPLEVSYKAGVEVTVTEIENAQLDNSVEVTVNG